MDVFHLYGISPAFLDVFLSLYTLGAVVVASGLTLFCHDMIADRKRTLIVILLVAMVWVIPTYAMLRFAIKDGLETRRARKRANLRGQRNT